MAARKKRKEKDIDIVVAGHICFDMIPKFPKGLPEKIVDLFIPGTLINVEELATSTGGPVSNTGLALIKYGLKVALMSKVGDDFIGEAIISYLKKNKVSVEGMKVVKGQQSSYTVALSPVGIDRMFLHNPGTNNTFGYEDVNFSVVERAKVFHLGYPPLMRRLYENDGAELVKIYREVKNLGVTTSLDVSLPNPASEAGKVNWDTILKNVLPYVDIFLPSIEEACFMVERDRFMELRKRAGGKELLEFFDGEDMTRISGKILSYGAKVVVLKVGYRGCYIRTAEKEKIESMGIAKPKDVDNWAKRELWSPSFYVPEVASATGSGDSAIAGFYAAYLRDKSIEECLEYACAAGAQNVTALDALSGLKSWPETVRQVESKPKKNELLIGTPGWKYKEDKGLWYGPNDSFME